MTKAWLERRRVICRVVAQGSDGHKHVTREAAWDVANETHPRYPARPRGAGSTELKNKREGRERERKSKRNRAREETEWGARGK